MSKEMTSRERVRKAINFEIPDRVPIDIGANYATGICVDAYIELVKYLGYDELLPPIAYEQFFMLARIEDKVRKRLHCDVIELENPSPRWDIENKDWKPWINQQGNTILMPGEFDPIINGEYLYIVDKNGKKLARMPKGGIYFDYCESLNMTMDNFKEADLNEVRDSIPMYSEEHLRQLEAEAKRLYEETDYAICGGSNRGGFTMVPSIAGHSFADWLCLLVTEPDYCYSVLETIAAREAENMKMYVQACGKYLDLIAVSSTDFGSQNGELFAPEIFDNLYVPNYKIINDTIHQNCNAKVFFHCCGSIINLFESFIAAGVDIINPIQISGKNMDPMKIKEQYGNRIVLWGGGVDTQKVLPFGTPEEVAAAAKHSLDIFAPGGGYVFNQVHDIQFGVPPANILAMVDTAYEYRAYR